MEMCNYSFGPFQAQCYASTETIPANELSTDKIVLMGEELSQSLQGSIVTKEDEIALLWEQMKGQYSASK